MTAMRTALYTLGALLFVAGIWLALTSSAPEAPSMESGMDFESGPFGDELPPPADLPQRDPDAERMSTRLRLPHGTLTVRARVATGSLPVGVQVGYRRLGGEPRWLNAREDGTRTIVDAPLGAVTAVARGPGLPMREQEVHVEAGVAAEVVITLEPAEPTAGAGASGD
jgi:hypothetical protein